MENNQWYLIETEAEYELALNRYDQVKFATKASTHYREKLLLVHLISEYEAKHSALPEVDPIELIKTRMEDFGYKPADLAHIYGDKGTVSKVLNYKQALSLSMIRKFGQFLHIPADLLIREYSLKSV
ncbi:MAG: helix-turn-helix domain-containing protein [Dyadobacter fermentans]